MRDRISGGGARLIAQASLIVSTLAFTATASPASAQTATATDAQRSDDIVVTARRQEERLQDVPAAVTAFSAQSLYENGAQTLGDLQALAPNLSLHVGDASNAVIYLRGIGQIDSISFNDPGVGVYLDDVYLGRAQGSFLEVVDPRQIEVLRGPQGTLYGRNTIGGAIKFVSDRPGETLDGYIDGAVGNYNERRVRGRISGPLTPDHVLLGSLAVATSERDGYTTNIHDGQDDGDKNLVAWRGSLLFQPTPTFSAYLTVDDSHNHPDHSRTPHRESPIYSLSAGDYLPVIADPYTVDVTYNDREELDSRGIALTLQSDHGPLTLKSITSYREMRYRTHLDLDASADQSFGIYDFEDQNQTSQEFQALYHGDRLSVVAGLFYFDENDNTFGGLVGPDFFVILPPNLVIPFPANTAGLRIDHNTSGAAYAQADWQLTDRASITVGVRYTHERKRTNNHGDSFIPAVAPTAEDMEAVFGKGLGYAPTGFVASETWSSTTPRIAFNYRFSDNVLGYVSAAEGFKSGGFNGRITTDPESFNPETLWSYEAGLKNTLFDRRVRLNLAAFYQDYKDMQVSRFASDPVTGNFTSVFDNAGGAEMYGFESELFAEVTQGFSLNANLSYLHSKYTEFVDGGVDVSDQRHLVNAPEWSGRLGARYQFDIGSAGDIVLQAGADYRSKTYLTVSSNEALAQGAFTLYDASILYEPPGGRWSVMLSGKNLSDEAYRDHAFDLSASPGVLLGYYGAPRTYSIDLRYRF